MNFLKRIWRKLFPVKSGVYPSGIDSLHAIAYKENWSDKKRLKAFKESFTYDPSEDPQAILRGEVESYFE